jgi:hypothetical protein
MTHGLYLTGHRRHHLIASTLAMTLLVGVGVG